MKRVLTWQEYLQKFDSFQDTYDNYFDLYGELQRKEHIIKNIKNLLEEYDTNMHLDDTIYIDEKFKKKLEEIISEE